MVEMSQCKQKAVYGWCRECGSAHYHNNDEAMDSVRTIEEWERRHAETVIQLEVHRNFYYSAANEASRLRVENAELMAKLRRLEGHTAT
jgi:hypothetical protein